MVQTSPSWNPSMIPLVYTESAPTKAFISSKRDSLARGLGGGVFLKDTLRLLLCNGDPDRDGGVLERE